LGTYLEMGIFQGCAQVGHVEYRRLPWICGYDVRLLAEWIGNIHWAFVEGDGRSKK
jgi:hypothetical protein